MLARLLGVVGIVLYVMVGGLYLASGLVVPDQWVFAMWALWIAGAAGLVRVVRRSPAWAAAVAATALVAWVVIVQLGDWLLGWTA